MGSSTWQHGLWARREVLADKPGLIVWGMKDRLFTPELLPRWKSILPRARVEELPRCGHFVCDESPNEVEAAVYLFIDGQKELRSDGEVAITIIGDH